MAFQVPFDVLDAEPTIANLRPRPIYAIDLCCGVGGFTRGLRQAGIQVLGGVDNDLYASAIYEQNFNLPVCLIDICKTTA